MTALAFIRRIRLTALGGIFLVGCQYEPDEVNFVSIPNEPITAIKVGLTDLGDTILLGQPLEIAYDLDIPKEVKIAMTVYIGEEAVANLQTSKGVFTISPFQFPEGFYPFRIEIITGSGTNSLADKLGYEALLFEIKKTVWVEKSPAQKVAITGAFPVDGNLVITWERYPKANFSRYLLYKSVMSEGGREGWDSEVIAITDRDQTFYADPVYIGGDARFFIVTEVTSSSVAAQGDDYHITFDRARIKSFETTGKALRVDWNKPDFYGAFQKYWLRKTGQYNTPYFESTNIDDISFTIPEIGFGKAIELELNTVPLFAHDGGGLSTARYSSYTEVFLGDRIRSHEALYRNPGNSRIYFYDEGYLYVMREDDQRPYDSIALPLNLMNYRWKSLGISPNGQYVYASSGDKIVRLDPITLDVINSTPLSTITSIPNVYPHSIVVGNQNLLAIDAKVPSLHFTGYSSSFMAVVDGNSLTVKDTVKTKSNVTEITANPDLSYIYENNSSRSRVYQFNALGQEVRRKELTDEIIGSSYLSGSTLMVFSGTRYWIIDLNTFAVEPEIPISDWLSNVVVDSPGNEVAGYNSDEYFISYSLPDFTEKYRVKLYPYVGSDDNGYQNPIAYYNGIVYSARGYRLKTK